MKKIVMLTLLAALALAACQPGLPPQSPTQTNEPVPTDTTVVETPAGENTSTPEAGVPGETGTPGSSAGTGSAVDFNGGQAELIAALEAAGAAVVPGDEIEASFFQVDGQFLNVNGQDVQVWEFADEELRQTASQTITGAGYIIGTAAVDWIDTPHFWAIGRLIVLYVGSDDATIDLVSGVLGDEITYQEIDSSVAELAQQELMAQLGIGRDQLEIVSAEQVTWPNGCLGLANAGEACTEALVPGWRVVVNAGGQTYEVRTDQLGTKVRYQPLP